MSEETINIKTLKEILENPVIKDIALILNLEKLRTLNKQCAQFFVYAS